MSAFPFDRHPVAFLRPRINHPYAWVGHIPFAYLLVDILRPRRLVELGTDSGNSYLAFCQAIAHLEAATRATAIDSWEGDPHARFYGESVYASLSAYHDPRYSGFSTLMRSWFDDAVKQFKDGSIDLLHIDGLHTYEAVRHDFETWLPKLSDRAVVIFHDSQVRERGFGVWKFIEELRQSHRCFDFRHSNGLAVVEVGKKAPPAFKAFMDHALEEPASVQAYFEAIAATIIDEKTDSPVQVGAEARNVECRVYYRKQGQEYDEARSVMLNSDVHSGPVDLKFQLPEGERPDFIRLDPADVPCVFGLRRMTLSAAKHKHPVVINNEPSRIRGVSGESLPASAQEWVRLLTLDSDPFIELAVEDVWTTFDKKSAITVEFGIEYETVLSAPELIPLAHSGALSLQESRSSGAGQWGYAAIQRQVVQIQSELQALAAGGSLNEHVRSLAKHVDTLTHNQTHSMAAFSERVDDIGQRLSQAAVIQTGSADALGNYVGQLAQHLDALTRNQTSSMDALSGRIDGIGQQVDRVAGTQADSVGSLGGYVGQLAQHLDALTRNQTSSMEALSGRIDGIGQQVDRAADTQADSVGSLGGYVGQLAQHLDQLTRNQADSGASFSERIDDIGQRMQQAAETQANSIQSLAGYVGQLAQHLDQLTRNQTSSMEALSGRIDGIGQQVDHAAGTQADSVRSLGGYVSQLAEHLDQLTRNQVASLQMQRDLAANIPAVIGQLLAQERSAFMSVIDGYQRRQRSSEARLEEIRRFQLQLSEQVELLQRQGVVQRIKRLLGA